MNLLDLRTVLSLGAAFSLVAMGVIGSLWRRNRERYAGLGFWFADYGLQSSAFVLVLMRGRIPDVLSIVVANALVILGSILLLIGLERFFDREGPQGRNGALLVLFIAAQTYFTWVHPSLATRNATFSLALLLTSGQCAWLLLRRIDPELRRLARGAAATLAVFSLLSGLRVASIFADPYGGNDFFSVRAAELAVLFGYQVLNVVLSFTLVLLVNSRLLVNVRTEEEKYAKVFRSAPHAILLTSAEDGRIWEANEAFSRISGYAPEEVVGKTTGELRLWPDAADQKRLLATLAQEGIVRDRRLRYRGKGGTSLTGSLSIEPIAIGGRSGLLSSIADITELTENERRLQEKSAELERFTYAVSHDLKSPLVTIRTFLEYLVQDLERPNAAKIEGDVRYIRAAAEKMGTMLDGLLELSRAGRLEQQPVTVPFRALVAEALELVAGRVAARGVAVRVEDPGLLVTGDRRRLVAIWQNLLDNAAKFMGAQPSPTVVVGAEAHGGEPVFFVRDNGIGIPEGQQERVFGLFQRLDPKGDGTGLGLALVRKIVEGREGKIWAESAGAGRGSCFRFTLPGAVAAVGEGPRA